MKAPKGGPGMREMFKAMKYLYGRGLALSTALITDGRFSGTNNGCFVGHISPEAAEGGPIAIVHDGDRIVIDVESRSLELKVPPRRRSKPGSRAWKRPGAQVQEGLAGPVLQDRCLRFRRRHFEVRQSVSMDLCGGRHPLLCRRFDN